MLLLQIALKNYNTRINPLINELETTGILSSSWKLGFHIIIIIIIIIIIVIIMTLQPFVGPWPLFHFLDPIHSQQDSLDRGSARRKASTYTQNNTNTE
jgi:Na+/proline symporter